MARSNLVAAVAVVACMARPFAQEPSVESLIRNLRSPDPQAMFAAFEELQKRGPAAAPAVPTLVDLLRRIGWRTSESIAALDVLSAIGAPAKVALPLLVHFMVESESGDMFVRSCIEAISAAMGPALVPDALSATAQEAKRWWNRPGFNGDPPSMFDVMALARTGFGGALMSLGVTALPALRQGLRDRDQFVQAEAAAWLGWLGPPAKASLPWLRDARRRTQSTWTRYEIDQAVDRIEGRVPQ